MNNKRKDPQDNQGFPYGDIALPLCFGVTMWIVFDSIAMGFLFAVVFYVIGQQANKNKK